MWWPASCHLIGKDILTTHTVYWPIMLYALELPMPECIFAHGWWLSGTEKMSKSKGNVVDPMKFIDDYGVDAFRYFLAAEMVMGQDASFTEELFIRRYNSDLANDLGNLVQRVTRLIHTEFSGQIPTYAIASVEEDNLRTKVLGVVNECKELIRQLRVDFIVDRLREVIRETNRYVDKRQPWILAKNRNHSELATVLYTSAEAVRIICGMLHPIMPMKMEEALTILGYKSEKLTIDQLQNWGGLKPGTHIGELKGLFPRIKQQK
jgi:methionyl-tRNA synthetase